MDFFDVIKNRHCTRDFDAKKNVNDTEISKIIDIGRSAPSAGGLYPIDFLVIKDLETKKKIAKICSPFNQTYMLKAPVFIIIIGDENKVTPKYGIRGRDLYMIQDGAASAENIFLAATALNLGCSWIGAFDERKLIEILNLEKNIIPQVIMPIGYKK